jgi:hypothetical protein
MSINAMERVNENERQGLLNPTAIFLVGLSGHDDDLRYLAAYDIWCFRK